MFSLALWIFQLVALVGGLIFLIMGLIKKSNWMIILGAILLLLILVRPLLYRFMVLAG
jgi:hypothetical protein